MSQPRFALMKRALIKRAEFFPIRAAELGEHLAICGECIIDTAFAIKDIQNFSREHIVVGQAVAFCYYTTRFTFICLLINLNYTLVTLLLNIKLQFITTFMY